MDLINSKRLGLALVISLVAVACAAPTIPSQLGDDDEEESSGQDITGSKKKTPSKTTPKPVEGAPEGETPPDTTQPPPSTPPPVTPPPAAGQCAQEQTGEACYQCCDAASNGDLGKADAVWEQCACEGQCAAACGNDFCNGAQPSAACETCLTNTCNPAADAACTSASCKAGVACLDASACDQKQ